MLAVATEARGRGAGEALVRACIDRARATDGCVRVVLSTQRTMHTRPPHLRTPRLHPRPRPRLEPDPAPRRHHAAHLRVDALTLRAPSEADTTQHVGVLTAARHKMYAHARCRRRGIRCESGTVPQRCTCAHPSRMTRTRSVRGPADSAPGHPARVRRRPGLAEWAGGRGARCARVRPLPSSPQAPCRARESPHVTIAPADPASALRRSRTPSRDRRSREPRCCGP